MTSVVHLTLEEILTLLCFAYLLGLVSQSKSLAFQLWTGFIATLSGLRKGAPPIGIRPAVPPLEASPAPFVPKF